MLRFLVPCLCLLVCAPAPARDLSVERVWRKTLPRHSGRAVASLSGGGCATVWMLADVVTVTRFDRMGAPGADVMLGTPGEITFEDLATRGRDVYLAVRATQPITVAGKTFRPRARRAGDVLDVPSLGLIVRLDESGPRQAWEPFVEPQDLVVLPLGGGDFVAGASWMGKESFFGHGELARVGAGGERRWSTKLPGVEVSALVSLGDDVGLSVRGDDRLALWRVDAKGAIRQRHEVHKLPSASDLGVLGAAVPVGDVVTAFGYTGGPIRVGGARIDRPGWSIQPFALVADARGTRHEEVAAVTGNTAGTGLLGGRPAAVVHVIHTGTEKSVHRGDYIVVGAGKGRALLPVFQYRYPGDDWEHGKMEVVLGEEIYARDAAFSGAEVTLIGACDGRDRVGCLERVRIRGL